MGVEGIKIYLDEDVRPLLAKVLKKRGYDIISACDIGCIGLSDEEQLLCATKEERAILTHNVKDFSKLHKKYYRQHFGILLSDQVPFKNLLRRVSKFLTHTPLENVKGQIFG